METIYIRGFVAVAKVLMSSTQNFSMPSQHTQLVYHDPGLRGAKDITEEAQLDSLPELGAIDQLDLVGANSINLEGYLNAVMDQLWSADQQYVHGDGYRFKYKD